MACVVDDGVECGQVVGGQLPAEVRAQLPQTRPGVAGGGGRQRGVQVAHEGALGLQHEARAYHVTRPAGGGRLVRPGVEAGLHAGPAHTDVLGQEAGKRLHPPV
ncbi:hypothetical protein [Streptomyces brevispora]|uniref:Uncharacterized protein n=1 Tax=Streptomyces brevispora TaxID=887462 RepID=A0ABZ1FYK4_9ACTN|nr:hypothetical protein [Streptomyces brevispora]WSC12044.1 hypothetical protein OIE64_03755 [Streptomyces brevispora]